MPRDSSFAMTETDSDEALLLRYGAGDVTAARLLVARLAPRVLRLAQRLLQDAAEAEDVTQEAMLRLWRIAPNWQAGGAMPSTWLHRVAVNLATDRLRRRRTGPLLAPRAGPPRPAIHGRGAHRRAPRGG